ncbi:hypothetical protein [Cupriavidus sp. RAF12]|uniref:hypothetical protein n=1 Tax=Cupriavidus sp. RAF12 TaxID=3233050 RepID=UPI003F90BFFB
MNTELILLARAFIADRIPERQLNLNRWVAQDESLEHDDVKPECGSIACIGGWLATSGLIDHMRLTRVKTCSASILMPWAPTLDTDGSEHGASYFWENALGLFAGAFGITQRQASCVFSMNGEGDWDEYLDPECTLTHKELALARFDYLLEHGDEA